MTIVYHHFFLYGHCNTLSLKIYKNPNSFAIKNRRIERFPHCWFDSPGRPLLQHYIARIPSQSAHLEMGRSNRDLSEDLPNT